MKDATDLDRTDKDISAYHVPDEALEAAGAPISGWW